jgi:hypothetical protein
MDEAFFASLFPKLECIIMERSADGAWVPRTAAPEWFIDAARTSAGEGPATLGGTLPFLDHLRTEADRFWWSGEDGVMNGEPFAVVGAATDYLVRARVLTLDQRKLLVLERLVGAADSRPVLQVARERQLEYERTRAQASEVRAPIDAIARLAVQWLDSDPSPASQATAREVIRAAEQARVTLDRLGN